jgi:integrase/recombinase XerC
MKQHVFKRIRSVDGKRTRAKTYSGRYRLDGDLKDTEIPLGVTDKQAAQSKLAGIVKQAEMERHGVGTPLRQVETIGMPLEKVVQEWVADLSAKSKNQNHPYTMGKFMGVLMKGCQWKKVGDIGPESFIRWRIANGGKAPKTLNEYLLSVRAFLNWLVKSGRIPANPLASVGKSETRGRTVRNRRALTHDEFLRLLAVADPARAVVYAVAYYTGLRRAELVSLCRGDFDLAADSASVTVHAEHAKNKTRATLPLHPDLREMLVRHFESSGSPAPSEKAFNVPPRLRAFDRDLKAAVIPKKDERGKVMDFHCFRHSCATRLASENVPLPVAMKLMRHSDPKLTAKAYVDQSSLPLVHAVSLIPGMPNGKPLSPDSSPVLGFPGPLGSRAVATEGSEMSSQSTVDELLRRLLSCLGGMGQMAPALGIEPRT